MTNLLRPFLRLHRSVRATFEYWKMANKKNKRPKKSATTSRKNAGKENYKQRYVNYSIFIVKVLSVIQQIKLISVGVISVPKNKLSTYLLFMQQYL